MALIKLQGNASGTGSLTVQAPNTNSDLTLGLPASTGTLVTTGDTGTVSTTMLADNAVTTAKITDVNVTTAKIADSAVSSIKLLSTDWTRSISANGYQKLPGGLIVQWGSNSAGGNGPASVSFPIAFPTACVNVQVTGGYSGTSGNSTGAYSVSTSGFTYTYHYSGTTDYWLALGY